MAIKSCTECWKARFIKRIFHIFALHHKRLEDTSDLIWKGMNVILLIFFLIVPLIISYLTERFSFLNKLGTVLVCYVVGLVAGHTPMINDSYHALMDNIINVSILIAIPILLFETKAGSLKNLAGITSISMLAALAALLITVFSGYYLFGHEVEEGAKVSGMLVGLYTGGTPNLASLKMSLDVSDNIYIGVHTFDTALGAVYLFFLLTVGKTWFRKFLPKYQFLNNSNETINELKFETVSVKDWFARFNYKTNAIFLGLGILIAGIGAGIGMLFPEDSQMIVIILLITSLGIGASLLPFTNKLGSGYKTGMYFINVFSLTIASRANFFEIIQLDNILFGYVIFVLFITFALHLLLSKIFKVDADTMMITSTAMICSPPFVPVIAGSLKNKELLIPGITVGIMGYAVGNYLGVIIALFLQ